MKPTIRPILSSLICAGVCAVNTAYADRVFPAWTQVHDLSVTRAQFARAVAVDNRGNVAVTGYIIDESNTQVLYVAKYDTLNGSPEDGPQGKLIWENTFKSPSGSARGQGITCDSVGNVIVTGWFDTANNQRDYITRKFSAADGTLLWSKTYNNDAQNGADEGIRVAVDKLDNVIVTGRSAGNGTNDDIYTVKYSANGAFAWERRFNHPGNRNDFPSSIVIDSDNNVVIAGTADQSSSTTKFYTGKYRANDGAVNAPGFWEKTFFSSAQGATDAAVDSAGNVIVVGPAYVSSMFNKDIHTIKYNAADGSVAWFRDYATLETKSWAGVAVDSNGDVFVTGTSGVGINGRRIYTTKYSGSNGGTDAAFGEKYSPGLDFDDEAMGIAVDPAGNVAVIGRSNSTDSNLQDEFYIARYGGTDGALREEFSFNGNDSGGTDIPAGIAMDKSGGFAVVGNILKPRASDNLFYNGIATIKFNRFLAVTGDPVSGPGVPDGSKLASLSTPALADDGGVAARVTITASKKTKLDAIFAQGATGAPQILAVQGADAPGASAAKYKSFQDPVISPGGRIAYLATLQGSGAPKKSLALFSNITGTLTRYLEQGQPISGNGLPQGTILKSISGISIRGNGISQNLIALVSLSGPEITKANSAALLGINTVGSITKLLQTGDDLTVDGASSKVAAITSLTSAKGSSGHGRWQSNSRMLARVVLADKRTAVISSTSAGLDTTLISTGMAAPEFGADAVWKTLGLPAAGFGQTTAAAGTVTGGNVAKNADSGLVFTSDGANFDVFAREGDSAPGVANAKYASFGDPVVSLINEVAFMATVGGGGVKSNNKLGIWSGTIAGPALLARQGDKAVDPRGEPGTAPWTSFLSLAYPGGVQGGPIFLAKVAGKKNNTGLWAEDSTQKLRQVIRVGDTFGDQLLTRFTVLQGTAGVAGATRSFNNTGAVGVLLGFKDKTQAIYYLSIP